MVKRSHTREDPRARALVTVGLPPMEDSAHRPFLDHKGYHTRGDILPAAEALAAAVAAPAPADRLDRDAFCV